MVLGIQRWRPTALRATRRPASICVPSRRHQARQDDGFQRRDAAAHADGWQRAKPRVCAMTGRQPEGRTPSGSRAERATLLRRALAPPTRTAFEDCVGQGITSTISVH